MRWTVYQSTVSCMFWRVQVAISQGSQCLPMVMLLVLTCLYSIEKNTLQCGKVGNVQLCLAHVPACSKYIPSKISWPVIVVLYTWRRHVSAKYPYIFQQDQDIMEIHMENIFGFWYFLVQTWDINSMPTPTTARWNGTTPPQFAVTLSFTKRNRVPLYQPGVEVETNWRATERKWSLFHTGSGW